MTERVNGIISDVNEEKEEDMPVAVIREEKNKSAHRLNKTMEVLRGVHQVERS